MADRKHGRPREGDLLGLLAHELRSPLNAILVWTRILRTPDVSEERRTRALEAIERNVRHQSDFLEDLVEWQRIRSGEVSLEPEPVEFGSVVRVLAETARREAQARGVELRFEAPGEPLPVFGDPGRLQKVVRTLLFAFLRFANDGGRIHVRVGRVGRDAELLLHDPDGAFPRDLVGRGRPQLAPGMLRGTGGAGVAVAVAEDLIRRHRGFLGVEEVGERGLQVCVRVPLDPASVPGAEVHVLKDVRILVVDDDPEVVRSLEVLLGEAGARVRTARSVRQGLAAGEVDVVVTDIALPGDGHALLRAMRARSHPVAVIALTAGRRPRPSRAGFDAVLRKPVEPERLLATLGRAFVHATPGSPAPPPDAQS